MGGSWEDKRFSSARQGCKDRDVYGSSTEEERWMDDPIENEPRKKSKMKKMCEEKGIGKQMR